MTLADALLEAELQLAALDGGASLAAERDALTLGLLLDLYKLEKENAMPETQSKHQAAVVAAENAVEAARQRVAALGGQVEALDAERLRRSNLSDEATTETASALASGNTVAAAIKRLFARGESAGLSDLDSALFKATRVKVLGLAAEAEAAAAGAREALRLASESQRAHEIRQCVLALQDGLARVAAQAHELEQLHRDFSGPTAFPTLAAPHAEALSRLTAELSRRANTIVQARHSNDTFADADARLIAAWRTA